MTIDLPNDEQNRQSATNICVRLYVSAAMRRKAEQNQPNDLAVRRAAFGQNQPFELTSTCSEYADSVKFITSIVDPEVIKKILPHHDVKAVSAAPGMLPECRILLRAPCAGVKPAFLNVAFVLVRLL